MQTLDGFDEYNLSPRYQFCNADIYFEVTTDSLNDSIESDQIKKDQPILKESYGGCIGTIDTQREKDIGLAPDYAFDPMRSDECIVSTNA